MNVYIYIIAFLLTSRLLNIPNTMSLYYGAIIFLLVRYYYNFFKIKLWDKNILFFITILFVSILFNEIPSFFRVQERFASFLFNMLIFSPLFISDKLIDFRDKLFYAMCNLFIVYVIISFLGLLAGVFPLIGYGGFQGVTVHGMSMSVVAAIGTLYMSCKYFADKKKVYLVITGLCLVVGVIAASRSALMGVTLSLIIIMYRNDVLTIRSLYKLGFLIVGIIVLLTVLPDEYFSVIEKKVGHGDKAGSIIFSRENLWESRIKEFKDSPIYGIGFSNVNLDYDNVYDAETGIIESGSSWGMVLSMSGILGMLALLLGCSFRIKDLLKSRNTCNNTLILSVFLFFVVHMFFEGYIFASGSIFMVLFWLTYYMTYRIDTKYRL